MRAWVDAAHAASPLRHLHAGEGSNLKGMGNFIRFSESIYFTHPHPLHVSSLYISSIKDRQHITAAMETSCLIAFAAALRFSSDWRNTRCKSWGRLIVRVNSNFSNSHRKAHQKEKMARADLKFCRCWQNAQQATSGDPSVTFPNVRNKKKMIRCL